MLLLGNQVEYLFVLAERSPNSKSIRNSSESILPLRVIDYCIGMQRHANSQTWIFNSDTTLKVPSLSPMGFPSWWGHQSLRWFTIVPRHHSPRQNPEITIVPRLWWLWCHHSPLQPWSDAVLNFKLELKCCKILLTFVSLLTDFLDALFFCFFNIFLRKKSVRSDQCSFFSAISPNQRVHSFPPSPPCPNLRFQKLSPLRGEKKPKKNSPRSGDFNKKIVKILQYPF